jgi:TraX protein.
MQNNQLANVNESKKFGFSTNILKIIAMICMTCDHVGYMLQSYTNYDTFAYILRIIGRITYPLIIFTLLIGLEKTHDIKKYITRLGIAAFLIYLGFTLAQFFFNQDFGYEGNIFLSLFLCAVSYYFLNYSKYKWLVIFPILYFVTSLGLMIPFAYKFFVERDFALFYLFNGLYCQYSLLTPVLFFGMYLSFKLYDKAIAKRLNNQALIEAFKDTPDYIKSKNALASILIAIICVICYLITYLPIYEGGFSRINDCALQSYMMIADLFILFYSGKRGYKNKVTQYSFYVYYPLHMVIVYLIFWLIFGY